MRAKIVVLEPTFVECNEAGQATGQSSELVVAEVQGGQRRAPGHRLRDGLRPSVLYAISSYVQGLQRAAGRGGRVSGAACERLWWSELPALLVNKLLPDDCAQIGRAAVSVHACGGP